MDHKYITPFITSARNVFSTMVQLDLTPRAPTIEETGSTRPEVSGMVTMDGGVIDARGA